MIKAMLLFWSFLDKLNPKKSNIKQNTSVKMFKVDVQTFSSLQKIDSFLMIFSFNTLKYKNKKVMFSATPKREDHSI